jgi:trans-aconitate 2-methyltransferase
MATWDPAQYQRFADERSRPFNELVERIGATDPATVVDLGCGTGQLTAALADRWPGATIEGIDSDDNMLAAAANHSSARVRFSKGDVATWDPAAPVDVIVSNATLQWIPEHLRLLSRFVEALTLGGWLAFQLPSNLDDAHHQAIRQLIAEPRWQPFFEGAPDRYSTMHSTLTYVSALSRLGCSVDAWETTYVHILQGEDPVLEWVKGTALRPVLARLTTDEQLEFCAELAPMLRSAYGRHPWGTPLPFRRTFVVVQRLS